MSRGEGMYSPIVLKHFQDPQNGGEMESPDATGTSGTPGFGPCVVIMLRVEGDRIADARFQSYSCGAAIAAGSVLTEMIKGKPIDECKGITVQELIEALGGLPPEREFCAGLAVEALNKALEELNTSA